MPKFTRLCATQYKCELRVFSWLLICRRLIIIENSHTKRWKRKTCSCWYQLTRWLDNFCLPVKRAATHVNTRWPTCVPRKRWVHFSMTSVKSTNYTRYTRHRLATTSTVSSSNNSGVSVITTSTTRHYWRHCQLTTWNGRRTLTTILHNTAPVGTFRHQRESKKLP